MSVSRRGQPVILAGSHVTLPELAEEVGMDKSYLSRILSGKRDPSRMTVDQAEKLRVALGFENVRALTDAIRERRAELQAV